MSIDQKLLKKSGKIPQIYFQCSIQLFNSSYAYVRVQSSFANSIQDLGITETQEVQAQKLVKFSHEFAIPLIIGFDHTQSVRISVYGGDDMKVGHGFPMGFTELTLMEISGQPQNNPILIQGEATIGYLHISSAVRRIRQDFDLTSRDRIKSLGFADSAPTLEKLRVKKTTFLDSCTSYTVEFHCSKLFQSSPAEEKSSQKDIQATEQSSSSDVIKKFLSMVKVKKLQFSVRLYVTTDKIPDELFFVDDIEIDDLDSWKMVYSTRRLDFFRPTLHDQSSEISEQVLMGEVGRQNHPNFTMAFVVLLHYVTSTGQEGIHTMAATVKNMTEHLSAIQEYLQVVKDNKKLAKTLTSPSTKATIPSCQIHFQKSNSSSRYLESSATAPSIKSYGSASDIHVPNPPKAKSSKHLLSMMSKLSSLDDVLPGNPKSRKYGGNESEEVASSPTGLDGTDNNSQLDDFTQALYDFVYLIRSSMKSPMTFTMYPRVDLQVVATGPKYEEKLTRLYQDCHTDWLLRMQMSFSFSIHMFQAASDAAAMLLQRLNRGCRLTPVVLVDMFHPCLQQTLLQRARQTNKKPLPQTETTRSSCHVLHALLTFYETLAPFFPNGEIRAIAGGNIRIPSVLAAEDEERAAARVSAAKGGGGGGGEADLWCWLGSLFGNAVTAAEASPPLTETMQDEAVAASRVSYVRRKGLPYVAELLADKHHHHSPSTASGLWDTLPTTMCLSPSDATASAAAAAASDVTAGNARATNEWNTRNLEAWQALVQSFVAAEYDPHTVCYRDMRDLVRGFMEASEAFVPVTDSFAYHILSRENAASTPRHAPHASATAGQYHQQLRQRQRSGSPTQDADQSNSNNNNSNSNVKRPQHTDSRYRRRRVALYTGTNYDIDLADEEVFNLLPPSCHAASLGKNHDFSLLRQLLLLDHHASTAPRTTTAAVASSTTTTTTAAAAEATSSAAGSRTVTPVVWILGRSPPVRVKVPHDSNNNNNNNNNSNSSNKHHDARYFAHNANLHQRLSRLSSQFPITRRDTCLVVVLAAEHRYDFPVIGRDGHTMDELRAIAHPFDDFHKEIGEVLKHRRVEYAKKRGLPHSLDENIFLIHQYAFSEVLARALEFEIMTDPFAFAHQSSSSSSSSSRRKSRHFQQQQQNHHHKHGHGAQQQAPTRTASSRSSNVNGNVNGHGHGNDNDDHHVVIHRLPKLSSLRAILSLIFCSNYHLRNRDDGNGSSPNTVDEHTIDAILGTGDEVMEHRVAEIHAAEENQKAISSSLLLASSSSLLVPNPLQAMKEVSRVSVRLVNQLGLPLSSRSGRCSSAFDRNSAEALLALKRDIIRDFKHLNQIKVRFDLAIDEYVRRQYQHIAATVFHDEPTPATSSSASKQPKTQQQHQQQQEQVQQQQQQQKQTFQPSAAAAAAAAAAAGQQTTQPQEQQIFAASTSEDDENDNEDEDVVLADLSQRNKQLLHQQSHHHHHQQQQQTRPTLAHQHNSSSEHGNDNNDNDNNGNSKNKKLAPLKSGFLSFRMSLPTVWSAKQQQQQQKQRSNHYNVSFEDDEQEEEQEQEGEQEQEEESDVVVMQTRPTLFPSRKLFYPKRNKNE